MPPFLPSVASSFLITPGSMIFVVRFSSLSFNLLIDLVFLCPLALSLLCRRRDDLLASLPPSARTFQFLPGSQTALTMVSHHCNFIFPPHFCPALLFSLPFTNRSQRAMVDVLWRAVPHLYPSALPAPERDSQIPAWRPLDHRNGVCRLDNDVRGARDLRQAL